MYRILHIPTSQYVCERTDGLSYDTINKKMIIIPGLYNYRNLEDSSSNIKLIYFNWKWQADRFLNKLLLVVYRDRNKPDNESKPVYFYREEFEIQKI